MSDLRETYFGSDEERTESEEDARDAIRAEWRRKAEFVACEYVQNDLKLWIETKLDIFEPRPGPHDEMLYNAGVREGIKLFDAHIRDIERRMEKLNNV